MKKYRFIVAAIVIVATVATVFVGCKKEKDEMASNAKKYTETQALMNQIMAFQELRESVNSGIKTEGVMSVEEMRQYLDLVSNYEHSEHMTCCINTVLDTLYLPMPPVDKDGNVADMDVVATYETFETELQNRMEMVDDGRDIPSYFSILMPEGIGKAEENITIVFVRGEENKEAEVNRNTLDDDGPFIEDFDNWHWGRNLGLCKWNPYNCTSDASEELSREFVFEVPAAHQGENYLITDVVHANYRPCNPEIPSINSHYYVDTLMEDCADTWLFCQVSPFIQDYCVMWWEMNCFYRSIDRNIVDSLAPLHFVLHPDYSNRYVPYHMCSIHWSLFMEQGYYYHVHYAHVVYCNILWVGPNPT